MFEGTSTSGEICEPQAGNAKPGPPLVSARGGTRVGVSKFRWVPRLASARGVANSAITKSHVLGTMYATADMEKRLGW